MDTDWLDYFTQQMSVRGHNSLKLIEDGDLPAPGTPEVEPFDVELDNITYQKERSITLRNRFSSAFISACLMHQEQRAYTEKAYSVSFEIDTPDRSSAVFFVIMGNSAYLWRLDEQDKHSPDYIIRKLLGDLEIARHTSPTPFSVPPLNPQETIDTLIEGFDTIAKVMV